MIKRTRLAIGLILGLFTILIPLQAQDSYTEDYEIEFDDWVSSAQLMLPDDSGDDFPVVILVHGSGPYDMNATSFDSSLDSTEPISENFLLIAEYLAENGYASLRYNKRGVRALDDYDWEAVQASTLDVLIDDAGAVIDFAQTLDAVDSDNIFLYGWSEGAWVVSNITTMRDDIAGLILQGAPQGSLADVLPYQYQEIALDYLRDVVDSDEDGLLSLDDIADVPMGSTQLMLPFFFYDPSSSPDNPIVNQFVDQNGDDLIDIDEELVPMISMYLSNIGGFLPPVDASYDTGALVAEATIPTLLLHGVNDGWVSVENAETIAEVSPDNTTLITYPELGHALSVTEILAEDGFYPMDAESLTDLVAWLDTVNR
ncbi:MAG: alpha/beta hydrolase [Phototrophicaceae bacterium]